MSQEMLAMTADAAAWLIPLLIGVILHEVAHGWAAYRLGDDTAQRQGRLSLNPIRHFDMLGSFLLPGALFLMRSPVLFGYARPVPVYFSRLKRRRLGMALVAAAGPGMNLLLAFLSVALLRLEEFVTPEEAPFLFLMFYRSVLVNLTLAFFNLLPVLPLDGGRILYSMMPRAEKDPDAPGSRLWIWLVVALLLMPHLGGPDVVTPFVQVPTYAFIAAALEITRHDTLLISIGILAAGVIVWDRWRVRAEKR